MQKSKLQTKNKNGSDIAGFTLIELLIAMTIFIAAIATASGVFVQALRSQRAIVDLIAVNDNTALALEQMAREIRVGANFAVPNPLNPIELNFTNAFGEAITYKLANNGIERNCITSCRPDTTSGIITGSNVKIERLNFVLQDPPSSQSRITLVLSVGSISPRLEGFFTNVQTTISPRSIEVD